jgi:hypothetical protein
VLDLDEPRLEIGREAGRIPLAAGALLLALSPYPTWVHVAGGRSFALPALLRESGAGALFAYLLTLIGLGLAVGAFLERSVHRIRVLSAVAGVSVALVGGLVALGEARKVSGSTGFNLFQPGTILGAAACAVLVVAALRGLAGESDSTADTRPRLFSVPWWGPFALGAVLALAVIWLPSQDKAGGTCARPVAALFKDKHAIPADTKPADVADKLQKEEQALETAKATLAAQSVTASSAQQSKAAADALRASASSASKSASAASFAATDAAGAAAEANSLVDLYATAIIGDQRTVDADNGQIADYQRDYDANRAAGDTKAANADQKAIADTRAKLAADQATLASDQQKLADAKAKAAAAQSALASAKATASGAAAQAATLAQQAADAQFRAGQLATGASSGKSAAQNAVDVAQSQLDRDTEAWQATYERLVTPVKAFNASVTTCRSRSVVQLFYAGVIAAAGAALSLAARGRSTRA